MGYSVTRQVFFFFFQTVSNNTSYVYSTCMHYLRYLCVDVHSVCQFGKTDKTITGEDVIIFQTTTLLSLHCACNPRSQSNNIFPFISLDLQSCFHRRVFRLVNEIYGLCSSDYKNNCLHTNADLVALHFVGWQASAAPPTFTWRNSRSSLKWRRGGGSCFLHHCFPLLSRFPHHWQQVCVNTSIKLDSWPAGSDKRKDVFEPGRKDDVHFGGDGKTVPVVITWLFGLLKPQFPQSKPLMCFRHSQFGGWLITMK